MIKLISVTGLLLFPGLGFAFNDIPAHHPYQAAISYGESEGIVKGYADGSFKPDTAINRAEFLTILIRSQFTTTEISACNLQSIQLTDVSSASWYAPYVCLALQNNIVTGYSDKTFRGGAYINFAEGAKIITTTFKLPYSVGEFTEWFEPYLQALENAVVIPPTISAYEKKVSRAEMMEMIQRVQQGITDRATITMHDIACVKEDDSEYYNYEVALGASLRVCELFLEQQSPTSLTEEIANLVNMRILLVSNTQLAQPLPQALWSLSKLTELQLNQVGLHALPEEVAQLAQLKRLDVRNNQLTTLPASLEDLAELEWLGISGNQLSAETVSEISELFPDAIIE